MLCCFNGYGVTLTSVSVTKQYNLILVMRYEGNR